MKVIEALETPMTQAEFALMNDISEARVSQLVSDGAVPVGVSGLRMHHAYVGRLREQAAGRLGTGVGGLDLSQERAALAREMRHGHQIKNAVARGTYASIELLSEVLAEASQSVVERFDQLPGQLRKACPGLQADALDQVMIVIAGARNEWVRMTEQLVAQKIVETDEDQGETVEDGNGVDDAGPGAAVLRVAVVGGSSVEVSGVEVLGVGGARAGSGAGEAGAGDFAVASRSILDQEDV